MDKEPAKLVTLPPVTMSVSYDPPTESEVVTVSFDEGFTKEQRVEIINALNEGRFTLTAFSPQGMGEGEPPTMNLTVTSKGD